MKKALKCLLTVFIGLGVLSGESQAATKKETIDQCVQAALDNNTYEAEVLASKVASFTGIMDGNATLQHEGAKCLNLVFGDGWYYYVPNAVYLNTDPNILRKPLINLPNDLLFTQLEKLGAMREQVEGIILKERIEDLEKHSACVRIVISQVDDSIEELNKITNQENQSLILLDTHNACSSLYKKDQSAAILNQSCIHAFQKLGHPNLQLEENDTKLGLAKELGNLRKLQRQLIDDLSANRYELTRASGTLINDDIKQMAMQDLEAKSCAEFGYEGVYLD